jgi:oligopeptide/dipeptide ABC transporter ATP-binding protein
MAPYFEVRQLKVCFSTYFGRREVLDLEELTIEKGQSYGLVGESGSGKSVLGLAILNLLASPPADVQGDIVLDGQHLLALAQDEMRRVRGRTVSMIFQDPMSTLNPVFSVGDQMMRVIRNKGGVGKAEARTIARQTIELVELPDPDNILEKYPHQLSGGQRQRIIIAIALSCGADFLIADEPTRNLDVTIQAGILKLLANLRRELGVTVLFIANNLGLVSAVCDRVGILLGGRIVETGSVREVVREPAHPYTTMLLRAIPKHKHEAASLVVPRDQGYELGNIPGCGFVSRCADRVEACSQGRPELQLIDGTHLVACGRPWRGGDGRGAASDHERTAAPA